MAETSIIVRLQCKGKESWVKLIKKSALNAIDLCLEPYTEDEVRELNSVLKHSNRFLLAYATPIISIAFLLAGRAITLFRKIHSLRIELTLNSEASSAIKSFLTDHSNIEDIITRLLHSVLNTEIESNVVGALVKHQKENTVTIITKGITYSNKKKMYTFRVNLITENNSIQMFSSTLIELLTNPITILKGFLTPLDLGKVEGLYIIIMAKMLEKPLLKIEEIIWETI
uniref:Uncharacterized protein n=1 Tax=Ignisphaera aggregans TaxID=334771 RepID=A0A7J2TBB4_9CREN